MPKTAKDIYEAYYKDIFTEPDRDPDTMANLGPLTQMAGIWRSESGMDINPKEAGPETQPYIEYMQLHPIDPQPNGPQLFYGLRYHTNIVKPGEVETFHDQVGYWLWEPATETVYFSLTIPRGQVAFAQGHVLPSARAFTVACERGRTDFGICSNPFLEGAFRTDSFEMTVTLHDDGSWSYDQNTVLMVRDRDEPFHHHDGARMKKVGDPMPNPLMAGKPFGSN